MAAVPILTGPFKEVLDRIMSYYTTDGPFPAIVIDHPIQNASAEVLRQRALQIVIAVEGLLEGI